MHRPIGELETTMTHREFMDWQRFEATVSPLPDRLADIHVAMICSLMVNAVRAPDSQPATAADFFVIKSEPPPPAPDDDRSEAERARAVYYGGA